MRVTPTFTIIRTVLEPFRYLLLCPKTNSKIYKKLEITDTDIRLLLTEQPGLGGKWEFRVSIIELKSKFNTHLKILGVNFCH